jgi:hypothetical protein
MHPRVENVVVSTSPSTLSKDAVLSLGIVIVYGSLRTRSFILNFSIVPPASTKMLALKVEIQLPFRQPYCGLADRDMMSIR